MRIKSEEEEREKGTPRGSRERKKEGKERNRESKRNKNIVK
jgi:hypothetical protein